MEPLKFHYATPRRAAYLNLAKNSGKLGRFESVLLIQDIYEKTAVNRLKENHAIFIVFIRYLETAV
jgi:hypothetical protein